MDIQEKMKIFEVSCENMLRKDASDLTKEIDDEIESQIKNELEEYEKKEKFTYQKKLEKMERDYNKQIYALEMDCKREILNQKKNIQKEIKKEVISRLKEFSNTYEYREFFLKKLNEALGKLTNQENTRIGILQKDKEKFEYDILNQYASNIFIIEDKYIGGCIVENASEGIYIDNTILNSINEKLEN